MLGNHAGLWVALLSPQAASLSPASGASDYAPYSLRSSCGQPLTARTTPAPHPSMVWLEE